MATPQEIFKALSAIPSYSGATILPNSTDSTLNIQVSYSQRDLERNVRRKFTRTVVASVAEKSIPLILNGPSVDTGDAIAQLTSPSGALSVTLRSVAGEKKKHFVEIWADGSILHLLETTALHDDFYADSTFGTLEWSKDESKIVYVAERKKTEDAVEKYNYKPDWGETFTGKREPALVVVNLDNFEVKVLDRLDGDTSPGQAIFSHDSKSLIFTGYLRNPQFFGIVYCQNRLTGLYQVNVDGSGFKHLTPTLKSARSPRLSADGSTLVFLSNTVNGPHASCAKLLKLDIASGKVSTVVDIVRKPEAATGFPGLYIDQLPRDTWVSASKIFVSSSYRSRKTLLSIDVHSGSIEELTPASQYPGTTSVLFANSKWVLTTYSTPTEPWILILGRIEFEKNNIDLKVKFFSLENSKVEKAKTYYQPHSWSIVHKIPGQLDSLEAIFIEPFKSNPSAQVSSAVSGVKPPLVIFPHGGPHSGFAAEFSILNLVLVGLGFAVANVNFTGSLGYGQDSVEALVGRVGELDVNECLAVRDHILSSGVVDTERTVVTGGSHGGFLSAHLLAKDPTGFKAAVLRNPVTDIPAMANITDITDWCYAVNDLPFDMEAPPTATISSPEVFKRLRAASPMEHVEKVTAPSLLLIGAGDRRVPPSQGFSWWQARQNKIKKDQSHGVNRIQVFEGTGHALDSVEAESNSAYSLGNFLVEFTRVDHPSVPASTSAGQEEAAVGRQGEGGRGAFI
ncbi:Alpha/Beta hydrolase protein [Linnemannia elongata]|nr:Alpha/Beta hydrolase protein [Linnemannia elongata]